MATSLAISQDLTLLALKYNPARLYCSDVKIPKNFQKFFSHKLHIKSGTVVTHPVDRLGGKFIGFVELNQ